MLQSFCNVKKEYTFSVTLNNDCLTMVHLGYSLSKDKSFFKWTVNEFYILFKIHNDNLSSCDLIVIHACYANLDLLFY